MNRSCPRCNTENEQVRRYCRSCGSVLGNLCDRCGFVNDFQDSYCAACGLSLAPSLKPTPQPEDANRPSLVRPERQYSQDEIQQLLSLRKEIFLKLTTSKQVSQDEIDKLFG